MRSLKIVTIRNCLEFNLNNRLGFGSHVANICNRVSTKLHALARISQFVNIYKRKMAMKTFIATESGYCPLV